MALYQFSEALNLHAQFVYLTQLIPKNLLQHLVSFLLLLVLLLDLFELLFENDVLGTELAAWSCLLIHRRGRWKSAGFLERRLFVILGRSLMIDIGLKIDTVSVAFILTLTLVDLRILLLLLSQPKQ